MTVRFYFIIKSDLFQCVKSVWQQYTEAKKSIQHLNNKDLSHQTTVCKSGALFSTYMCKHLTQALIQIDIK